MAKGDTHGVDKGTERKPPARKAAPAAAQPPKESKEPRGPHPVPRLKEAPAAAPPPKETKEPRGPHPVPRLKEAYRKQGVPALMKEFGYKNPMQVPKLDRIVLNVGMGEAIQNVKLLESAVAELGVISGQRPVVTKAKKAIAGFKLRQGMPIGAKVTLRSDQMYEFLDRLVSLALPRIRDFRGVSPKAFDGRGNYTLGLKEQLISPTLQDVQNLLSFLEPARGDPRRHKVKLVIETRVTSNEL